MKETSDKELKITEERVKATAEKCGTAKEILKELFPDVFKVAPPEWKDISSECRLEFCFGGDEFSIADEEGWNLYAIKNGQIRVCDGLRFEVKIEGGKIWRKWRA